MLKKLKKENMGNSNLGWLESRFHFSFAEYRNPKNINFGVLRLLNIVSSQNGDSKIKIYQDVNIYITELDEKQTIEFNINEDRQIYFVQIEGESNINNISLENGDAMEIKDIDKLKIDAISKSHILFIEMQKK